MSILSLEQQKRSLSKGKKGRYEKVAKIALDNPFPEYWPLLNSDDAEIVKECLLRTLVQESKLVLPWKKLSKMSKEARKREAQKIKSNMIISTEQEEQRQNLLFGLNEVIKCIEKSVLVSCILSGDVEPAIIIKHIVTSAAVHNVPVVILPGMKNIVKQCVGFSTIAVGLKDGTLSIDSRFHELHNLLKTLASKYSVPGALKRLYNSNNSMPIQKNNNIDRKINNKKSRQYEIQEDVTTDLNEIYCYRISNSYRAFIPEEHTPELNLLSDDTNQRHTSKTEQTAVVRVEENKIVDKQQQAVISMYQPFKLKYIGKNINRKRRIPSRS